MELYFVRSEVELREWNLGFTHLLRSVFGESNSLSSRHLPIQAMYASSCQGIRLISLFG